MVDASVWKGREVLITGHTGFKGTWLTLWLHSLGARVSGISLLPPSNPNLFDLLKCSELMHRHELCDIRDYDNLSNCIGDLKFEVVFHLAAQPIVRVGYHESRATFETNTMGTVNLLDIIKGIPSVRTVVVVTSDKCYRPSEQATPYNEENSLGGRDPYSASKACAEIVCDAYRHLFTHGRSAQNQTNLFTARAGNVIGGGDFGIDRLVPDCVRAVLSNSTLQVRHPSFVRSWIHVLDVIEGYLLLAEHGLSGKLKDVYSFNFSPLFSSTVATVVEGLASRLNLSYEFKIDNDSLLVEASQLLLNPARANRKLGWSAKSDLNLMLESVSNFVTKFKNNEDLRAHCLNEIIQH